MKDWKIVLITAVLLAVLPFFFLSSNNFCIGSSNSMCALSLIFVAVLSVPLIISLLSAVVLFKNIATRSLSILVLSFSSLLLMILALNHYSYLYWGETITIVIIIIFEIVPSIILVFVNFRSYQKLIKKEAKIDKTNL